MQEKKRLERRRSLVRWGALLTTLVVAGFVAWLLLLSPFFRVHTVTVSGTDLLSTQAVLDAAEVPSDSPMLRLDTEAVAERVATLPAIADVEVGRDFPDTITIDVTERGLVYQRVEGDAFEWVDAEGMVFSTSAERSEGVVQASTNGKDTRLLKDVATVVSHIPDKLLPRVVAVQARAVDRITLELDDGALVVWGSAEQSALKADVLAALLPTDAKLYDISAPSFPTTK